MAFRAFCPRVACRHSVVLNAADLGRVVRCPRCAKSFRPRGPRSASGPQPLPPSFNPILQAGSSSFLAAAKRIRDVDDEMSQQRVKSVRRARKRRWRLVRLGMTLVFWTEVVQVVLSLLIFPCYMLIGLIPSWQIAARQFLERHVRDTRVASYIVGALAVWVMVSALGQVLWVFVPRGIGLRLVAWLSALTQGIAATAAAGAFFVFAAGKQEAADVFVILLGCALVFHAPCILMFMRLLGGQARDGFLSGGVRFLFWGWLGSVVLYIVCMGLIALCVTKLTRTPASEGLAYLLLGLMGFVLLAFYCWHVYLGWQYTRLLHYSVQVIDTLSRRGQTR